MDTREREGQPFDVRGCTRIHTPTNRPTHAPCREDGGEDVPPHQAKVEQPPGFVEWTGRQGRGDPPEGAGVRQRVAERIEGHMKERNGQGHAPGEGQHVLHAPGDEEGA